MKINTTCFRFANQSVSYFFLGLCFLSHSCSQNKDVNAFLSAVNALDSTLQASKVNIYLEGNRLIPVRKDSLWQIAYLNGASYKLIDSVFNYIHEITADSFIIAESQSGKYNVYKFITVADSAGPPKASLQRRNRTSFTSITRFDARGFCVADTGGRPFYFHKTDPDIVQRTDTSFKALFPFNDSGYALASPDTTRPTPQWMILTTNGNKYITRHYTIPGSLRVFPHLGKDDLLLVQHVNQPDSAKYSYVNVADTSQNFEKYEKAGFFKDGIAAVKKNSKWNLLNRKGELLTDSVGYSKINRFLTSRWIVAEREGEWVFFKVPSTRVDKLSPAFSIKGSSILLLTDSVVFYRDTDNEFKVKDLEDTSNSEERIPNSAKEDSIRIFPSETPNYFPVVKTNGQETTWSVLYFTPDSFNPKFKRIPNKVPKNKIKRILGFTKDGFAQVQLEYDSCRYKCDYYLHFDNINLKAIRSPENCICSGNNSK